MSRPHADGARAPRRPRAAAATRHWRARRDALGATRILTAHHADDQIETLLLRMAAGTTIAGLGGVARVRGALLRPLLDLDASCLRASLAAHVPPPVEDPSNRDPTVPRNRLRHHVLPALEADSPGLRSALAALPRAALGALAALERTIARRAPTCVSPAGIPALDRFEVVALPPPLRPLALAALLRRAGQVPPPGPIRLRAALEALERGHRFELRLDDRLLVGGTARIEVRPRESRAAPVSYTVSLPGEIELHELGLRMRISRVGVEPWMFEGRPDRAAFDLPAGISTAEVRTRRPGDRIRPLGSAGERKLKQLLIDRKVPRERRSRLPLLLAGGRIVWVPGVTIDEAFRLRGASEAWLAELEPLSPAH